MWSALALRNWAYSRLRLRPSLPSLSEFSPNTGESKLYRSILEAAVSQEARQSITGWIDVGCRNWSYLPGILQGLPSLREAWGIELDPGRIYWNGFYRGDYAQAAAQHWSNEQRAIRFLPGDFSQLPLTDRIGGSLLNQRPSETLVTHFFPFVSEGPCRSWGLPTRYADFKPLIEQTCALQRSLTRGSLRWLSLHQGEWEAEIARKQWQAAGFALQEGSLSPSDFQELWPGKHPLFWMTHRTEG